VRQTTPPRWPPWPTTATTLGEQGAGTTAPTLGDLLDASEAPGALNQAGTSDMVTDLGVDPAAEIPATLATCSTRSHPLSLHDELAAPGERWYGATATTARHRRHAALNRDIWPRWSPSHEDCGPGDYRYGHRLPVDVDDSPLGGLGCPEVSGSVGFVISEARDQAADGQLRTWRAVRSRSGFGLSLAADGGGL